jgi:hypothetical protein
MTAPAIRYKLHDLYDQLLTDELRDLLDDAGVLDDLRDLARLTHDDRGLVPTLQHAVTLALHYELEARAGNLDVVPEWGRMQEAAE